jgi:hypothetical protein
VLSAGLDQKILGSVREPENPESITLAAAQNEIVRRTLAGLTPKFREVIILREMEAMSYKELLLSHRFLLAPSCRDSFEFSLSCCRMGNNDRPPPQ